MSFRRFALSALACFGLGAMFFGCSTDLDPNADYKEVMVIYSILSPLETTHYVKVHKAFLNTNSNALTIAANNPDSTTYGTELQVKLQKLKADSSVIAEYALVRVDTTGKEAGTFTAPEQVLYRSQPNSPGKLDENAIYRIVATNIRTGTIASAATELVKENATNSRRFCINQINRSPVPGFPCLTENFRAQYDPQFRTSVVFRGVENASIYTAKLIFNYTETTDGVAEQKQVSWYLRQNFIDETPFNISIPVEGHSFYDNLMKLINTSNDNVTTKRTAGDIFISITAGSTTLATYYRVNNSFSVISQTRPEYDNVKNGHGLVGSRLEKAALAELSKQASDTLKLGKRYLSLKFK